MSAKQFGDTEADRRDSEDGNRPAELHRLALSIGEEGGVRAGDANTYAAGRRGRGSGLAVSLERINSTAAGRSGA